MPYNFFGNGEMMYQIKGYLVWIYMFPSLGFGLQLLFAVARYQRLQIPSTTLPFVSPLIFWAFLCTPAENVSSYCFSFNTSLIYQKFIEVLWGLGERSILPIISQSFSGQYFWRPKISSNLPAFSLNSMLHNS